MAKDDQSTQRAESEGPMPPVESKEQAKISDSAFHRLLTLQQSALDAAERMRRQEDYPDFFVEGSGPPWHEMWPEVIRPGAVEFTPERMAFVDRLGSDDYPDFFVEGSGPPWHEMWPEVIRPSAPIDPIDVRQRMRALRGLNVIQAFVRMRSQTGE